MNQCKATASDGTRCELDAHPTLTHRGSGRFWVSGPSKPDSEASIVPNPPEALTLVLTPAHLKAMQEAGFKAGNDNPATWLVTRAERAQDFEDDFAKVNAEKCAGDEVHCSCVVHLRGRIRELEAAEEWLVQQCSQATGEDPAVIREHIGKPRPIVNHKVGQMWRRVFAAEDVLNCPHERTYQATEVEVCRVCSKVV